MDTGAFEERLAASEALLAYFSTPTCRVCHALRPKVEALLAERFPRVDFLYVDSEASPALAAQNLVFAAPTVLLFFLGREHTRFSRNLALDDLAAAIERPYDMLFGED